MKGVFIVIEGIDGSGKTEISKRLANKLKDLTREKIIYTQEPYSNELRKLSNDLETQDGYELTLLFSLDRAKHVREVILPNIISGNIVISDRYYYSTIAYQGAMFVNIEWIREVNKYFPKPDFAFLLKVPPEICGKRKEAVGRKMKENEMFRRILHEANEIYLDLEREGEMIGINGELDIDSTLNNIVETIREKLPLIS